MSDTARVCERKVFSTDKSATFQDKISVLWLLYRKQYKYKIFAFLNIRNIINYCNCKYIWIMRMRVPIKNQHTNVFAEESEYIYNQISTDHWAELTWKCNLKQILHEKKLNSLFLLSSYKYLPFTLS